ncbi:MULTISPECIES: TonB-dependent receptor [unclassified Parabacteroides]|uniref:TonB-dependent receptor n=1 Tax=unclassified Parabacteroides TaxID=2649774 RepID=UPI0024772A40|nr:MULTISPECIES: TonB-dependent receptor [unclassified Parabacteroides]
MRITVILFFVSMFTLSAANSYSQTTEISLNLENVTVQEAFDAIKQQSDFSFWFRNEDVDLNKKVSARYNNQNVDIVLKGILSNQDLSYTIDDTHIIIYKKNPLTGQARVQIIGEVRDQNGEPIIGANIIQKGDNANGTITDIDGKFMLSLPENATLIVSYIGYITQEVQVGRRTTLRITLEEDTKSLEEVVVVGYGKLSKRKVSGAISNVRQEDFNQGVSQSASDLLRGRVAGLVITSSSGDITSEQTIRLRGTSSLTGSSAPFVVIDGIPGMSLDAVSPDDIESISVLKDASASAIYGSRSASGVILITTKKGMAGTISVDYQGYLSADHISAKPNLLTADEWRAYAKEKNLDITGLDMGANTDWIDEITRTGFSHNHNLSISGGLKSGSFRIAMNYMDRKGIMKDNYRERYNGLVSFNQRFFKDKLNLSMMAGLTQSDYSPTNSTNVQYAYNMLPTYPVKNADGSYYAVNLFEMGNPVHNIKENLRENKANDNFLNLKADIEPISGLVGSISLFKQRNSFDGAQYNSKKSPAGQETNGYAYRKSSTTDKELMELTATYTKEINNHQFDVLAGYSYEENEYRSHSAANRDFLSDMFTYNNIQLGEGLLRSDIESYKRSDKLISFFGRANYSFGERFILSATVRRDGSSKFGKNNKWATFPSVSAAWRLSDESFMKNIDFLDDLKIRVGYGIVGNQSGIDPYQSIALYGSGGQYYDNGDWHTAYQYSQNNNPDLKWEQTSSFNPGIDFTLFNGRLGGSFDYYIKETKDLLYYYTVPVPPFLYNSMLANVGDMKNKGFEIELHGKPIETKDFEWNVSFNLAHNKNKVVRLSNEEYSTEKVYLGGVSGRGMGYITSCILEEGQEIGTFYNYKHLGFDENGRIIIWDKNDDGELNSEDYTYIGHAQPDFTYGINNSFRYKNIDLSFFFRGVQGNDVLNSPKIQYTNPNWLPGINVFKEALTSKIHPADANIFSDYYLENGSFLRLENITLGYTFKLNPALMIKKLRVYATGQNLFVITKFSGMDPEVNMDGLAPGILDVHYIPRARTFTFGVNLSF